MKLKPFLYSDSITDSFTIKPLGDGYKSSVAYANDWIAHPERHIHYQEMDNWDPDREYEKQLSSKVSEFLLRNVLKRNYNIQLSAPDINIYTAEEKKRLGHDADLYNSQINLHVKSCPIGNESWLFKRKFLGDAAKRDLKKDWVALTVVDLARMKVYIRALLPLKKLIQWNIFKNPRKQSLTRNVAAVYLYSLLGKAPGNWLV